LSPDPERRAVGGSHNGPVGFDCLTLTTDYGYEAGFVGVLHAVARKIAPHLTVINADHSVAAQDVRMGARRLERFVRFAPTAVHVAVVDPGVGGSRRAVAAIAGNHGFVGPDNGLLCWAAESVAAPREIQVVVLENERYFLPSRSATFDGRDIFVPAAAHLACGADLSGFGPRIDYVDLVRLERPRATVTNDGVALLELLQIDHFGNVQTSGDEDTVAALSLQRADRLEVATIGGGTVIAKYATTFSDAAAGEAIVLLDSDGCLALSVNCGRGDSLLELATGAAAGLAAGNREITLRRL